MELNNEKRKYDEPLEAHAHIWNQIFNFIKSMSLKCAVELNIPDIIHTHGRPMTLSDLVAALPSVSQSKSHHVHRLMRILVHSGFFSLQKIGHNHNENGYTLTPSSLLLLKENPLSARPYILAVLDPVFTQPWQLLSSWFQNDEPKTSPFSISHGRTFWDLASQEERFNGLFNEAMASDSWLASEVVTGSCKEMFKGVSTFVDVGGNRGTMAMAIANAFPEMKCTVLDLPHVVAGLQDTNNLKFVVGDMFESIPPADAILLKMIFHMLSDEDSLRLLKKCKEAIMKKGDGLGKVIIIDMVMGNQSWVSNSAETMQLYDLEMLVLVSGQERNEEEWAKLFSDAGFSSYKISPVLGLRSVIEVYP